MRRVLGLMCLLLMACLLPQRRIVTPGEVLDPYVGQHISRAVEDLGPPTSQHQAADNVLWMWRYASEVMSRSDSDTVANPNRLLPWSSSSESTRTAVRECVFWLIVDPQGIILGWRSKGACDLSGLQIGTKRLGPACKADNDCPGFQVCDEERCREP